MQKTEKQTTSSLIWKTAGKTTAVLCVLLVLFCAFFVLLAPKGTSDFFYSMGMKKAAASLAYTQAEKSDDFDDWWNALVRCIDAENWGKAYSAADKIMHDEDYDDNISKKTFTLISMVENNQVAYKTVYNHDHDKHKNDGTHQDVITYDAGYYVRYNYVKCGLLAMHNEEERASFLNYAIKDLTEVNGWGIYISNASSYPSGSGYNIYTPNALKGYIDALCVDTSIPLDNVMSVLYELYNHSGRFANADTSYYSEGNWYSSKKRDLACYVVKLCRARPNEPSLDNVRYQWHNWASVPMPENETTSK